MLFMNHLFKNYLLILLIAVSFQSSAQNILSDNKVDSLLLVLHLPTLDSLLLIREYTPLSNLWSHRINKNRGEIKNATLHKLFQKIERLAAENKNPGLEMHAGLWQYFIELTVHNSDYDFNLNLEKIAKKATNSGVFWVEIQAKYRYAYWLIRYPMDVKSIEKGIWILRENIEKIHEKEDSTISSGALLEYYRVLTGCYYDMDDLPNAILYSLKALNIEYPRGSKLISPKDRIFRGFNNNLGVYYREQNELDSSTFYFKKVFDLPITKKSSLTDSLMHAVSGGNLGENLYLQGNYNDALPLLQKDADMNTRVKTWGNASNALILMADIYLIKGDLKKAKQTLDKATFAAHSSKEIKRLSKLYPILSKYYKAIGQASIALTYADSTIFALDSLKRKNNQFRGANVEEAYNKYQLKRDAENTLIEQLKSDAEKQLIIKNNNSRKRNIGLFCLVLLVVIGYYVFRKFKLKAKQKENILGNKVKQVTSELSSKDEQLKRKIQEISEKENTINWSELKISSDEKWDTFLELFQNEHPNFIVQLKSKFPSVTAGEIRFLCLTRLGLDDAAIASILGVNVNSISQARRRFMRKSKIENLVILKELVFSI
jgi:tetratricopeptide (TPR) repeat protein